MRARFSDSPLRDYESYIYDGESRGYINVSTVTDEKGSLELSLGDYYPQFPDQNLFWDVINQALNYHPDVEVIEVYTLVQETQPTTR